MGDVDAIAEYVVVVAHNISNIDADPVMNPLIFRYVALTLEHPGVKIHRTAHSILGACKLNR